jgi:succinate-acetate transporter protein
MRTSHLLLTGTLALLGLSFLFLMIGEFANANVPLLMIGGWIGIVAALMAWYSALANLLTLERSPLKVPMGQMA